MLFSFLDAKDFGPLSSREVALLVWLVPVIGWCLSRATMRHALGQLVQSALKWQIVLICLVFWLWLTICSCLLAGTGFWNFGLLKDTLLWGTLTGLSLVGRCVKPQGEATLFRSLFCDSLAISAAIEFLSNLYTLPFWLEFAALPVFTVLMLLQYGAQRVPNGKSLEKILGCLIAIGVSLVFAYLCTAVYQQSQKLLSTASLRQFALPFLLTATSVPAFYSIALYSRYESLFVVQNLRGDKSLAINLYVRLKLMDLLRSGLAEIGVVHRRFISDIMDIYDHDMADAFFIRLRRFLKEREGGPDGIKARSIERIFARSSRIKLPRVPLFKQPWTAAELVIKLGLKDSADGEPAWRSYEPGDWYSLASLRFETEQFGGTNCITCMHSSGDEAYVEKCRWTVDILEPEADDEVTSTAEDLIAKYLVSLGCELPSNFFEVVARSQETKKESNEAWFILKSHSYKVGYGWELSIISKFPS